MKKKSRMKWVILAVIMLAVAAAGYYAYTNRQSGMPYIEEAAEIRDVITYYSFSGNIDTKNKQNVTYAGNNISIESISVKPGDYVHVGDILYTLDTTDVENNLAAAAANLELAQINLRRAQGAGGSQSVTQARIALTTAQNAVNDAQSNYDRTRILFEAEAVAAQTMEQATTALANAQAQLVNAQAAYDAAYEGSGQNAASALAQYDQAQASYNIAQNALSNRIIKAKVDGIVADVYVQENSTLYMGDRVMDVVDYDSLIVEIRVDEYEIASVSVGKEVDIYLNALEKNVSGVITRISNQARKLGDLSYFTAEVALKPSGDLRVGLSSEVRVLNVYRPGVVTISLNALQFDIENKPFVYVGTAKSPVRHDVGIGDNDGVIVEITEGLSPGDPVLVQRNPWAGMMMGPMGRQVNASGR